uniref:Uncharacterized protein n=1 Tax=Astyanax mexicanus TaxID=7994 RepID=A0A3B1JKA5_ASTMX
MLFNTSFTHNSAQLDTPERLKRLHLCFVSAAAVRPESCWDCALFSKGSVEITAFFVFVTYRRVFDLGNVATVGAKSVTKAWPTKMMSERISSYLI